VSRYVDMSGATLRWTDEGVCPYVS
jgi:hypothetical protein